MVKLIADSPSSQVVGTTAPRTLPMPVASRTGCSTRRFSDEASGVGPSQVLDTLAVRRARLPPDPNLIARPLRVGGGSPGLGGPPHCPRLGAAPVALSAHARAEVTDRYRPIARSSLRAPSNALVPGRGQRKGDRRGGKTSSARSARGRDSRRSRPAGKCGLSCATPAAPASERRLQSRRRRATGGRRSR